MEMFDIMKKRHSVRSYTSDKIDTNIAKELQAYIDECNKESGLNIQLCLDEPDAFDSFMKTQSIALEECKQLHCFSW